MTDGRTFYELIRIGVAGEVTPMTRDEDADALETFRALMQAQAPLGVEYRVRVVQAVTHPYRVLEE